MKSANINCKYIKLLLILPLIIIINIIVFWDGLNGPLIHDSVKLFTFYDTIKSSETDLYSLSTYYFSTQLGRYVSMLSFAVNFQLSSELSIWGLKLTNVIIHSLCGVIIYLIFSTLVEYKNNNRILARYFAMAIAALWMLSPTNASTVFFTIQRMQQLSTLFLLASLYLYSTSRIKIIKMQSGWVIRMFMAVFICWPLAIFSKENGIIFPVLAIILEINIFRLNNLKKNHKRIFVIIAAVTGIISLLIMMYLFKNIFNYDTRSFSLAERLMTQSRVLLSYVNHLLIPLNIDISIFADDFPISKSLFTPVSTIISIIIIITAIIISVYLTCRNKAIFIACGIQLFFAGHILESTIIPLEIYYDYRNYLASIGIYLTLIAITVWLIKITKQPKIFIGIFFVYMTCFAIQTKNVSNIWSNEDNITLNIYNNHPKSYRSVSRYAQYSLEQNHPDKSLNAINRLIGENPGKYHSLHIQKMFIQCMKGIIIKKELSKLPQTKPLAPLNELSQALNNLQNIANNRHCLTKEATLALVATLDSWAANFENINARWSFDYFSNSFLLSIDSKRAISRLQQLYVSGNNNAGLYMLELFAINSRDNAAIKIFNSLKKIKLLKNYKIYNDYKKQILNVK